MKRLFTALIFMCALLTIAIPAFAASSVTITEHSIMFFVSSGKIGFQETLNYTNPGGEAIKITLPKGAEEVSSASAAGTVSLKKADFLETANGMQTTIKVPKGNDIIELRYFVKPVGNGFDYSTVINYPSNKIQLLSTGDVVPFGHRLGQLPKEKAANGFYVVPVNLVKPGEILQVRLAADPNALSGKADSATTTKKGELPGQQSTQTSKPVRSSSSSALIYILIVCLVILLTAAGFYFMKMRKQS